MIFELPLHRALPRAHQLPDFESGLIRQDWQRPEGRSLWLRMSPE
jgi:hypothetical protein